MKIIIKDIKNMTAPVCQSADEDYAALAVGETFHSVCPLCGQTTVEQKFFNELPETGTMCAKHRDEHRAKTTGVSTVVAQPGDMIRVDRDGNVLADPQGFGSMAAFEAAVDAAGMDTDQHPGTEAEGWRIVAVTPRTGPARPEGEDGPEPDPDPSLERVWIR